jgi:hypothetical protein
MSVLSFVAARLAWPAGLIGLGLATFAVVGLSGPGRIDVVDGQARFEVGRSLVDHRDSILRDERVWFSRFPGRGGAPYSYYRFPQSLVAAAAIRIADATGPVSEGRRHFFFVLAGAVACGCLSVLYAIWFRQRGCGPVAALGWGAAGVFCTPMWFYGTSTFDEYLGTTVLIAALILAALGRERASIIAAIAAGLLLGVAFNCKQPLAAFSLLALAWHDNPERPGWERLLRATLIVLGLVAGIAAEQAYDRFKFPFDKSQEHAEALKIYGPVFADHQLAAAAVLSVSPGAGAIWYFPPILLAFAGVFARRQADRRGVLALLIASALFLGFLASLSFFKGDPCWGPRYLTPWFAVLWLFAPAGAGRMRSRPTGLLLGLGVVVQMLGLSVDPHRLYVERDIGSGFGRAEPWLYFNLSLSHLPNRPREIIEIAENTEAAEAYSPALAPTFAFPVLDRPYLPYRGPEAVRQFRVLNSYRPWWCSMTFLAPEDRPVNLGETAAVLLGMLGTGLLLLGVGSTASQERKRLEF